MSDTRTNHTEQIMMIRAVAYKPNNVGSQFSHRLLAAAALLEVHDDTGISLDDWVGPREFVNDVLAEFGLPGFEPNGV